MMTIGQVIAELERAKPEATVRYSFASLHPTTVDSWRGIYSEPALGWEALRSDGPKVKDVIAELRKATDGRKYTGWKGGDYSYDLNDTLHIDNPGQWTSTELARIEDRDYCVVLHTECDEA